MSTEAGFGAASGAMQGFAVAGPVGAFVGAALGFASGNAASKARKHMKRAGKIEYEIKIKNAAMQRRDMMRSFRMQRAMQTAAAFTESGGITSSTVQTAMGSLQSQYNTNMGLFDWSAGAQKQQSYHLNKAGAEQSKSNMIASATQAILAVGSAAKGAYDSHLAKDAAAANLMASQANLPINMPQYSSVPATTANYPGVGLPPP